MTNIYYSDDRCAAGKSYHQREMLVTTPALHVLAIDRREMISQTVIALRTQAAAHSTDPVIVTIYSQDASNPDGTKSVRVMLESMPHTYTTGHVIVVCTHEAIRMSDLSDFTGWSLAIDETPSVIQQESLQTETLGNWFDQHYELVPDEGGRKFSQIIAKPKGRSLKSSTLASRTVLKDLTLLHSRVLSGQPVYVDLTDFSLMDVAGCKWTWHSLWLPENLKAFERVEIVANGFRDSITAKIWDNHKPGIFNKKPKLSTQPFQHRNITIRYFAEDHRAGTNFWDNTEEGKDCLRRVAEWLAETDDEGDFINAPAEGHVWSCNTKRFPLFAGTPGKSISPRATGTNAFADFTHATMIYSAKPSPEESAILDTLGITYADAVKARETEDLIQFACRIGRKAHCSDDLTVTVYDRSQAEALQAYFENVGHYTVKLQLIDLGFSTVARRKPGRPKSATRTPAEAEAQKIKDRENGRQRQAEKRARDNAAKLAAKAA